MTIEPIITRLIGKAEQGDTSALEPSPATLALSQRLRALVNERAAASPGATHDRGFAEEAVRLAAYLDGSMEGNERADYERELARSPERRDEVIAAAAWLDAVEARRETPPAEATAFALSLEPARAIEQPSGGIISALAALFSSQRLRLVTTAVASAATVAVAFGVTLHMNPALVAALVPQSAPERAFMPAPPDKSFGNPIALTGGHGEIAVTQDVRTAAIGYYDDPSQAHRQQLLAALARAGLAPEDAGRVQLITVQAQLRERLADRSAGAILKLALGLTPAGDLELGLSRPQPN